jgi:hypothetical protein
MEVCDHETDNDGQIIIYTDHAFDENDAIVSLGLSSDGDEE